MLLLDVNPLSLGMSLVGGVTQVVIERNSTLPVTKVWNTENAYSQDNYFSPATTIVEGKIIYIVHFYS